MNIHELYARRASAWEAAKNFLDTHRMENGMLSAEDGAVYDRMEKDINDLTNEIGRLQRLSETEKMMKEPVSVPITEKPSNTVSEPISGRASKQYAADMLTALRTNFRQISDILEEGNDANGGYLVPEEWDKRLIDTLTEENIFRRFATAIKTSGEHKINIAATKPAASWIEEGAALSFGDAAFDQKVLDAHKLHVAIKVTEELLYDNAFNLERYIVQQFGKALGNAEEDAFLNGDGNGKPAGIFDPAKGGEVCGTATSITADKLIELVYALKRPYRKSAKFILNDVNVGVIRKLKDSTGAYIWQPSYIAGEPDRVLGYEVYTSAYAPKNAVSFGDYSYYNIGDRGTRSFSVLRELFAGNGMIGYVAKERVDGLLVLPEAVQILKVGSASANP